MFLSSGLWVHCTSPSPRFRPAGAAVGRACAGGAPAGAAALPPLRAAAEEQLHAKLLRRAERCEPGMKGSSWLGIRLLALVFLDLLCFCWMSFCFFFLFFLLLSCFCFGMFFFWLYGTSKWWACSWLATVGVEREGI